MKVTLERLPESRVQLDIEVDPERVAQSRDAAYRRLAPKVRVPGFRPGKAPRAMTERYIGESRLMNEALDKLVPDVYNEAIESEDVDAIAQPELDKVELEPMRFKFIVPVRPTVELGDYKAIRVEPEKVDVTAEMVDEQLTMIRKRYALQVPVERPVQWDDILIGDVGGKSGDEEFIADEDAEFQLKEGETLFIPGLAEAFVGMSKGEEKTLEIAMPEDFRVERFAGNPASFTLRVKEVKEEELPELDDDFAAQVNADEFPTFAALKERIENDLRKSLQDQADAKLRQDAIEKLLGVATIEFPKVLVDREIDHLVQESAGGDQAQYANYLRRIGRSEEEYREMMRPAAEERVKRSLALSQLAESEGIEVTDGDIEKELDDLVAPMGDEAARFKEMFSSEGGIATIRRNLISRRTLDKLAELATSGAPDTAAPARPKAKAVSKNDDTSKAGAADTAKAAPKPRKPRAKAAAAREEEK